MSCLSIVVLKTLFAVTASQVSITVLSNEVSVGASVDLTCTVPDFTDNIFVIQGSNTRGVCIANSPCTSTNSTAFTIVKSGSNLVIFKILTFSTTDVGSWFVRYGTTPDSTPVILSVLEIIVAVILILSLGKLIAIIAGCVVPCNSTSHILIQILRYLIIKKCKYPVPEYILRPCVGETAELKIDRTLVLAYRADSSNISPIEENTNVIFSINIDSDKKYGVYLIDILIEDCEDKDKIEVQTDVTAKITPVDGEGKAIEALLGHDKPDGQIKFKLQFHPNHGDFVTIKDSDKYMFADKCTICGMTFRSMQIIIAAALNQLVTIIPTVIVLAVVYCYYRKFDRSHAALLVVASAVVFPILNIGVYMLTVLCCCRKLKFKREDEVEFKSRFRTLRTALLIMMHLLPVAWFVLIVLIIVKKCREKCHKEEQNNTENHEMSTGKKGSGDNLIAHGHRRLPPITVPTLNGTDEQNENNRKKKKSKKDKKAKQITNSPENVIHPKEIQNAEQLSGEIVQSCITDLK